jgi:hypothetical protein
MSERSVVKLEPHHRLGSESAHAVVAAQLRGESKAQDEEPGAVVAAVAREIEDLGLEPDRDELRDRYDVPAELPEGFTDRPTAE